MDFNIGSIIYWALVGGLLGWIVAAFFRDGRFGLIGDIIIGAIGAIVGGMIITSLLGVVGSMGILLATAIGAFLALLLIRLISSRADASGSPLIEPVQNASTMVASTAATTASSVADTVADTASATVDAAADAVDSTVDAASDAAESVADTAADTASATVDAAADAVDSTVDAASDAAESVADTVADTASATVDAASDAAESVADTAADTASSVSAAVANSNYPDDLTQIKGIGKVYQSGLFESGVFTWDQIAHTSPEQLKVLTQAIDASNPDTWPSQAKQLAADNDRVGARYTGPTPSDLSKIGGLGKGAEHALKIGGIITYQQLADASAEQLGEILSNVRGNPDVGAWITQAKKLAG